MSDETDASAQGAPNTPEFTVSELSGAVRRAVEGEFAHVRVRGEVGRVSRPRSGHVYLDLKDENAVLAAIIWRGVASRLTTQPEEGMEVVATGRLTTFPGQSRYQIIIEGLEPAGAGALMAMLDARRRKLAAEGLFDDARKRPIPYLPQVIGVITSPSGAVIRDILHRLRDRFPRQVLVWPVAVQGASCAQDVARAIAGFNALAPGGPVPRPDVLIVARGGGSVEDLWGFNEEIVVRAAAENTIPLISAVGHETDTTLIDHAADRRAPTPTAAAEMAVPVRAELMVALAGLQERKVAAQARFLAERRQRLRDLARALPRPESLTAEAAQRLDFLAQRLPGGLRALVQAARVRMAGARLRPADLARDIDYRRDLLARVTRRMEMAAAAQVRDWRARLESAARLNDSLSYKATLQRGYALVRGAQGQVLPDAAAVRAGGHAALTLELRDGALPVRLDDVPGPAVAPDVEPGSAPAHKRARPRKPGTGGDGGGGQGSLF